MSEANDLSPLTDAELVRLTDYDYLMNNAPSSEVQPLLDRAAAELRRSRDLLRWRDVKVEPLPSDRNAVVEYVAIRADRTIARDVAAVWFVDKHRRQDTTHWRPLTPGPDHQGEQPEAD